MQVFCQHFMYSVEVIVTFYYSFYSFYFFSMLPIYTCMKIYNVNVLLLKFLLLSKIFFLLIIIIHKFISVIIHKLEECKNKKKLKLNKRSKSKSFTVLTL